MVLYGLSAFAKSRTAWRKQKGRMIMFRMINTNVNISAPLSLLRLEKINNKLNIFDELHTIS